MPVVVIDPRRTETAKHLGTQWLPVRPGTDSALMLAVLHVLVMEDLTDEPFIAAHATGFEALRRRVLGQDGGEATTPAWAAQVCGTPAWWPGLQPPRARAGAAPRSRWRARR